MYPAYRDSNAQLHTGRFQSVLLHSHVRGVHGRRVAVQSRVHHHDTGQISSIHGVCGHAEQAAAVLYTGLGDGIVGNLNYMYCTKAWTKIVIPTCRPLVEILSFFS